MKEKELIALGFNRKDVTAEESGEEGSCEPQEKGQKEGQAGSRAAAGIAA